MTTNSVVTLTTPKTAGKRRCGDCDLKPRCVGRKLPAQFEHVVDKLETRASLLQRGETLYQAGENFSQLYIVRSGCIKSVVYSASGEEHITAFYLPGDVIGFDGLASSEHTAHTVAVATSSVCAVAYSQIAERCAREPQLQLQVMRWCASDITRGQDLVKDLTCRSAPARFARFITTLTEQNAERGFSARRFTLPMMRSDIAHHLGMAPETISRAIRRLQSSGALCIERNNVTVLDPDKLDELAETTDAKTLREAC